MNPLTFIFQDWKANKGNRKGRMITFFFRIANLCTRNKFYLIIGIPYIFFYRIFIQWIFCLEIPWNLKVGKGFSVYHGLAIIINKNTVIGENCTIRHCTTLGNKKNKDGTSGNAPVLGNNVDIGNNVCIIGDINIGDNVKIGSGSVVVKNVMPYCVVAGNPAVVKATFSPVEVR